LVATAAARASKCKVWTRTIPCPIGTSIYDSITSTATATATAVATTTTTKAEAEAEVEECHYDRMLVDLVEPIYGNVTLSSSSSSTLKNIIRGNFKGNNISRDRIHSEGKRIPFGRSKDCPTLSRQAKKDFEHGLRYRKDRPPYVGLAVVGIIHDPHNDKFLITKRPSYMRSFPGAFVFPGGSVDEDESLTEAVTREIQEETGLTIEKDSWKLECLWESVYPTMERIINNKKDDDDHEELDDADDNNNNCDQDERDAVIRAHHLVCYFLGQLPVEQNEEQQKQQQQALQLCEEEVDGAVWLSYDEIQSILDATTLLLQQQQQKIQQQNFNYVKGENVEFIYNNSIENLLENKKIPLLSNNTLCTNNDNAATSTSTTTSGGIDHDNINDSKKDDCGNEQAETQKHIQTTMIPLSDLVGIYPRYNNNNINNNNDKNILIGMAQGSLFALEELFGNNNKGKGNGNSKIASRSRL